VLWRHGRTSWNADGRFQGQTDVPLDGVGEAQARRAARLLAAFPPAVLVSSDLARARATAAELATVSSLDVRTDPGLRELYAGSWEGRFGSDIAATDADRWREWRQGVDVRPGGGETRSEVADRAERAIKTSLAELGPGEVLVATTHGGTARALIGRLLGLPVDAWHAFGGLANCSWSVLEETFDGGWRLTEHNAGTLPEPVTGTDDP
jgi:probable phosphoglycerate mutase